VLPRGEARLCIVLAVPRADRPACRGAGRTRQVRGQHGMTLDRIFIIFAVIVGLAVGNTIAFVPQSRTIGLAPYFWILLAFSLFEGGTIYIRGGGMAPPITMPTRLIGFGVAIALMITIPWMAGVELKLL